MTTLRTPIISFDLRNRGRKHTGKKRPYETVAGAARVCAAANSPAVQERVKAGDMVGFLGHSPRIIAGTPYPPECAMKDGKMYYFEPAFRTVLLKGYPDGTIEHQVEFLDNPPGRVAYRDWSNRIGGFSFVIDDGDNAGVYGTDYVHEPNYVFNRGWAVSLDSAHAGSPSFDSAAREYNELIALADRQLRQQQSQYDELLHSHARLMAQFDNVSVERDGLLDRLARADLERREEQRFKQPARVSLDRAGQFWADVATFDSATSLTRVQDSASDALQREVDADYQKLLRRYGLGRG